MLPRFSVIRCFQYSLTLARSLASWAGSTATEGAGVLGAATAGLGAAGALGFSFGACAATGDTRARDAPAATRTRRSSFKGPGSFRAGGRSAAHCLRPERVGRE